MNKKNRKRVLEKLTKKAYVDESAANVVDAILANPILNNIQNSDEYAQKVFELILSTVIESEKSKLESK